jgi:aryl-alcohol dehydrogenase-like predicted oxidoreductase
LLDLAFSWLLSRRAVASVIAGATKPEQIEANAKAGDWSLTAEELAKLDESTQVHAGNFVKSA